MRQAGYKVVAWRRAILFEDQDEVEDRHGQGSLFEDAPKSKKIVGRLSFFRRLHISKGGIAASHEDVFFAELVGSGEGAAACSSPPFNGANTGGPLRFTDPVKAGNAPSQCLREVYGASEGQIGGLPDTPTERTHP